MTRGTGIVVIADPAKPEKVRVGIAASGIENSAFAVDFSTVKVFSANAKGVTGKLTGSGVLIGGGIGGGFSSTCKYSLERTSDDPPAEPATCDEPL